MTRSIDLTELTSLALACSLALLGCEAPEKSVGQETEGESSSTSDSGMTSDGSAQTGSPGSMTGAQTETDGGSGSDTGSATTAPATTGSETTASETDSGGPSLPAGFEPTLAGSGCADMVIFAASPDGSIGLGLTTGGDFTPVADAVDAGETVTTTHDVSEFGRLEVMVGTNVTYPECNDALEPDAYAIDQTWVATAGSVEIEIVPDQDAPKFGTQGSATVTITGLEVTLDGVTETLEDMTFADVGVGWLPG